MHTMSDPKPEDITERYMDSHIEEKGAAEPLDLDEAILRAQGHEVQLERSFSWMGALGLAFSIVNSWLTYAACFGIAFSYGGGLVAIFSPLISGLVQWIVLLGVAELSSAFPSSGGQYHFTYIVSPNYSKSFAAYVVGMINVVAWWVNTASGTIYTAISAFGICEFLVTGFTGTQWQVYLCYLLVIVLTLLPIFVIPQQRIENMTKTAMFLSIIGFILVILVCIIMGRGSYHPSSTVDGRSTSGWGPGVGWLLGIGNGEYAFAAAGACVHIAEEIPHPSRKVPLVINLTMILGIFTLMPWIIAMTCVIQDVEAVQNAFLPTLELFYQATGSKGAAAALQVYMTTLYYTCVPSQWITSSRMTWAFSRDNGLPFSNYWSEVDPKRNIPIRATLLSAGFCIIYGLLYIASTQAFNSIINTAVLMLNITYTVPQAILIVQGRQILPKSRSFNLGRFGYPIHIFSVIWLIISGIFFCFPTSNPPKIGNMNYNSVVISGIFGIVLLCWIERRKKFCGPAIDWSILNISDTDNDKK